MARFTELEQRLDPYLDDSNVKRSERILTSRHGRWSTECSEGLSIVVLNLDSPELLWSILTGFDLVREQFAALDTKIELIVGDTGSSDPQTLRMLDERAHGAKCVRNLSYHFSRNNNELFGQVQHATTLFLNNDVLIGDNPSALVRAYDAHLNSGEIVSVVLDFPDRRTQHRGVDFLRTPEHFGLSFHPGAGEAREVQTGVGSVYPAATGAFLMIDSALFARLGGFDEIYEAECQDVDLCLRAHRLGVGCRIVDGGPLVHLENATRPKGEENWADRRRFVRRWSSYIETI